MFPHDYFGGIFAPDYFPPVVDVAPVIPPVARYGGPRRRLEPVPWPVELDDDELMFWIE